MNILKESTRLKKNADGIDCMMNLCVFLGEDLQILAEGIRAGLARHNITVVDVASNLEDIQERFAKSSADVLVVNARLISEKGVESSFSTCRNLLESYPDTAIVMYSHYEEHHSIDNAYKIGIKAFLLTTEGFDIMGEAIRVAAEGKNYVSPMAVQILADSSLPATDSAILVPSNQSSGTA